jgi:hypothetical protein
VLEALSQGLAVLCLDHGGPPVVARAMGSHVKAVPLRERDIPKALARALELATREPRPPLEPPVEASLVAALVATAVHATAVKGSAS